MSLLFISYKRGTSSINPLRKALEAARYRTWYDKLAIQAGQNFTTAIDDGIDRANAVIVGLTAAACESEYIQHEVNRAREQNKPIFPVKVEAFDDQALSKLGLENIHYIDFTGSEPDRWQNALQELLKGLSDAGVQPSWFSWPRLIVLVAAIILVFTVIGGIVQLIKIREGQLPDPKVFTATQLSSLSIHDVAIGGDSFWLATNTGLWHYSLSNHIFTSIPDTDDIQSIGTTTDGKQVWIGYTMAGQSANREKTIGYYNADTKQLISLNPDPPLQYGVDTIVVEDNNHVWFGTQAQGVILYDPQAQTWKYLPEQIEGYSGAPPFLTAARLTIQRKINNPKQEPIVWLTNLSLLYRFSETENKDAWTYFSGENTSQGIGSNIKDMVSDVYQNLWVAHDKGISLLTAQGTKTADKSDDSWLMCTVDNSPLPKGVVLRILTSNNGTVLWIVTDEGIARVPISENLPKSCDQMQWKTWMKHDDAPIALDGLRVLLAVEEKEENATDKVTLWMVKFDSNQILFMDY